MDMGEVNPSVGDSWFVVSGADGSVLGEGERDSVSHCDAGKAGCDGRLAWDFPAAHAGETDLVLRYCYRMNCRSARAALVAIPANPSPFT